MNRGTAMIGWMAWILSLTPITQQAQQIGAYPVEYAHDYTYDNGGEGAYNTPEYYNSSSYNYYGSGKGGRKWSSRASGGFEDGFDSFPSGISSYQGTTTGPGPNGGYPAAPRGVYQTNYITPSMNPDYYGRTPAR